MKKILIGSVLALIVAVPGLVLADEATSTRGVLCPQFMPPSPDFCTGGKIVTGKDERGCPRPPQCERPGAAPVRQDIRDIRQDVRATTTEARQGTKQEIKDVRQETRVDIQGQRVDLRTDILSGKSGLLDEIRTRLGNGEPLSGDEVQAFKEKRDALQADMTAKMEAFRQNVETVRQGAQAKVQAARQALQEKLKQFRDDAKKKIVERLAQGLDDLNVKIVGQFTDALGALDRVIVEISSRADKAEANGKDVSAVRTGIASAKAAIAAARTALGAQAGKTYPVNLTSEDAARADVTAAKQSLETDLKAVRALVQAAREAVKGAVETLRQIPGVDSFEFTTSAESQNGTTGSPPATDTQ